MLSSHNDGDSQRVEIWLQTTKVSSGLLIMDPEIEIDEIYYCGVFPSQQTIEFYGFFTYNFLFKSL